MKKVLFVITFLLFPSAVFAADASLLLVSSNGVYNPASTLTASLVVNSGGGVGINAAEGTINFNPKEVKVKKIDKKNSIFSLWTTDPKVNNASGTVMFGGGIPKKSFKDTAGLIFNIVFQPVRRATSTYITITSSSVLAANGMGENVLKKINGASYVFGTAKQVAQASALRSKYSGRIVMDKMATTTYAEDIDGFLQPTYPEIWYVYPKDKKRYAISTISEAKNVYNKFYKKVTHKYILKYKGKKWLASDAGYFIRDTGDKNRTYYISPVTRKEVEVTGQADETIVLRNLAAGLSAADLFKVPDSAI